MWIDTGDGNGWWQDISYEGNLKYCSKCKLHGHNLAECRKMRMSTQERIGTNDHMVQGGNREQMDRGKGINQPRGSKEVDRQRMNQDWIPVTNRKSKPNMGDGKSPKKTALQGEVHLGDNNPFNPILVEEGEIVENLEPEVEEEEHEKIPEPEVSKDAVQQRQNRIILTKSNSADHLADLLGKEHRDKVPMIRSNSMSDIPVHCKESRLDYLREEFHHYHLIAKHLKKTKEDTLKRLKLMEIRQSQDIRIQEDIQHGLEEENQMEMISQVPETQLDKSQDKHVGETSRKKKKKGVQVGKKPLTRADKKQLTPTRS